MKKWLHKVISIRNLTPTVFVLRFERNGLDFAPGQFLNLGLANETHQREYSIYSGNPDPYLEVLIKEIPSGHVSSQLRSLVSGDHVAVSGPHGAFTLDLANAKKQGVVFIGTGTGISPFHCFTRSYPELDYQIIHGIRQPEECYDHIDYSASRYTACLSKSSQGPFSGRVTDYLQASPPNPKALFYLCGNSDMIYDVFALLQRHGVHREQVFTEVYF